MNLTIPVLLLALALICMIIEAIRFAPTVGVKSWMALSFAFIIASWLFVGAVSVAPK